MLNEYIWKIEQLESASNTVVGQNYVVMAHWAVQGTKDGIFAKIPGKTKFNIDPAQISFVPYSELTEQIILSWIWNLVDKTTIEGHLDIKINNLINPPITSLPLPWVN